MMVLIFQRIFLKMNKFAFVLYFLFTTCLLFAGCAASTYLMNAPEPSPKKEIQQAEIQKLLELWHGRHISKAIQEWGTPHGISNTDTGSKIYIYQTPSLIFLQQSHREIVSSKQAVNLGRRIAQTPERTIEMYQLMFHTDPKGIIYKISTERDLNPSAGSRSSHLSQEKPRGTK